MSLTDFWKDLFQASESNTHSSRAEIEAVGPAVKVEDHPEVYELTLGERPIVDMSNVTPEALNEQVQSLAQQGKFQVAADIMADWAFWDMVGRYSIPPEVELEDNEDGDFLLDVPVLESEEDEDPGEEEEDRRASMIDLMQVRLDEEFGEQGWHP